MTIKDLLEELKEDTGFNEIINQVVMAMLTEYRFNKGEKTFKFIDKFTNTVKGRLIKHINEHYVPGQNRQ